MITREEAEKKFNQERRDFGVRLFCWFGVWMLVLVTVGVSYVLRFRGEPNDGTRTVLLFLFGWGWGFILGQIFNKTKEHHLRKLEDLQQEIRSTYVAEISGKR
jgi:hypothetical protein